MSGNIATFAAIVASLIALVSVGTVVMVLMNAFRR
jgi:hypothetical protein